VIYEFNHVGIFVRDLDTSLHFYVDVLGGQVVDHGKIAATRTDCVYVQLAGGLIELIYSPDPPADRAFGLNHLGFMTDELDSDYARLMAAGYPALVPPKVAGTGHGRLAMTADPSGARIELLQRNENYRIPAIIDGLADLIDHVGVIARDLSAAEQFYETHLSMRQLTDRRKHSPESGATAAYFAIGDDVVELLDRPEFTADTAALRHLALLVDDLDTARARLASNGVTATSERAQPGRTGRLAVLRDPDGVELELLQRGPAA
jgi:catechol 2,3-dioxygenase-like lactoylglutathione lyase family enzyme